MEGLGARNQLSEGIVSDGNRSTFPASQLMAVEDCSAPASTLTPGYTPGYDYSFSATPGSDVGTLPSEGLFSLVTKPPRLPFSNAHVARTRPGWVSPTRKIPINPGDTTPGKPAPANPVVSKVLSFVCIGDRTVRNCPHVNPEMRENAPIRILSTPPERRVRLPAYSYALAGLPLPDQGPAYPKTFSGTQQSFPECTPAVVAVLEDESCQTSNQGSKGDQGKESRA